MLHLAAHFPKSSHSPSPFHDVLKGSPFHDVLFSFEGYHLKGGTKSLSSFALFVLHLAEISISDPAAPLSCTADQGEAISAPAGSTLALGAAWHFRSTQVHWAAHAAPCQSKPVLLTLFWSAQTRFLQRHCCFLYDPQGSHNTYNIFFF